MTNEDIVEFLTSSQNVVLLPPSDSFPYDIGELVLTYTTKQNIDWVVFSLFFQDNYSHTYNTVEIIEKSNGKIDLRFNALFEDKTVDITATDLKYNKEKFNTFVDKYRDGDHINMKFSCWKEETEMAETTAIDPNDRANEPIHITSLKILPLAKKS